ncbi:MAG: LigA protein [Frankiales bacterium]|nr:LigA protein [Frankiales bacterium]
MWSGAQADECRVRTVVAILLLLLVVGCSEQSRVDPKATVTVHGSFVDVPGSPLQHRPVKLGSGVSVDDGTLAYLTLGLACTSGICRGRVKDAETDEHGGYRFTLKGKETQSSFGEAESFLLTASSAAHGAEVSGASTSARFRIQRADLAIPALHLVDPKLVIAERAGQVGASWSAAAPGPYVLTFETDAVVPVWRTTTSGSSALLDPRLLEDTAGRAVLAGGSHDQVVGSDLAITWRSPGLGYTAAAGAPPSRSRPCGAGACSLTDGDLSTTWQPSPGTTSATIDLGRPVATDLVVVRGCVGGCAVEVSGDGRRFRTIGSAADQFGALRLPRSAVRFVRVGLGRDGLREVSVWGPAPGVLKNVDQQATERLQRPFGPEPDEHHYWPVGIAAVLVGAGLLGVGFAAGRRRRA